MLNVVLCDIGTHKRIFMLRPTLFDILLERKYPK
jgi:hypothetical protein